MEDEPVIIRVESGSIPNCEHGGCSQFPLAPWCISGCSLWEDMVWVGGMSGKGLEVKPGACGIECISMPNISARYNTLVGSIQNHQDQLFKTHNSVQIKDLLQQTGKQRTDEKETQSSSGIIATQDVNVHCQCVW